MSKITHTMSDDNTKAAEKEEKKAAKAAEKVGAEAVGIYDRDGQFVREYSANGHGPEFVKLAEGFASAPKNARFGYQVKKLW